MGFGFGWELGRAWPLCVSTVIMQGPPSAGPLAYRSRELGLPAGQGSVCVAGSPSFPGYTVLGAISLQGRVRALPWRVVASAPVPRARPQSTPS